MGKMSGLISSMGDAIEWDHPHMLQISPKNPASNADVDIGPDDGWAFFDLALNYRNRTDAKKVLIHGTSQSSLWGILGGMQVTASTASEEAVGVWTSLRAVEALGYCPLSHGQNTWARIGICIRQPGETEDLFVDQEELSECFRTRGWRSVVSASSSSDLRRTPRLWSYATREAIASCSISIHSLIGIRMRPSVVWATHKFFPENYMGPIGLSVEEENLRAAPGTPQAAQADGGMLFARIVPKSNMSEAIQGETFDITLTKGYTSPRPERSRKSLVRER